MGHLVNVQRGLVHPVSSMGDQAKSEDESDHECEEDRIDPADNDQTLDNVAPVIVAFSLSTSDRIGQCCQRGRSNEKQDPTYGDGHEVGEDTKGSVVTEHLKANDEDD